MVGGCVFFEQQVRLYVRCCGVLYVGYVFGMGWFVVEVLWVVIGPVVVGCVVF